MVDQIFREGQYARAAIDREPAAAPFSAGGTKSSRHGMQKLGALGMTGALRLRAPVSKQAGRRNRAQGKRGDAECNWRRARRNMQEVEMVGNGMEGSTRTLQMIIH
ncbi:hypothetical protein PSPO01_11743 [Paraphaeosphaeria sporulosa]